MSDFRNNKPIIYNPLQEKYSKKKEKMPSKRKRKLQGIQKWALDRYAHDTFFCSLLKSDKWIMEIIWLDDTNIDKIELDNFLNSQGAFEHDHYYILYHTTW